MKRWIAFAIVGAGLTGLAAACSPTSAAPTGAPLVSEARATEIATNALEALNAGDYAGYSRDWSETMKAAIKEQDFLRFRDAVLANVGHYVSIESVARSSVKPGTYRYTFTVRFERGSSTLAFGFRDGGTKVEGVFAG